MAAAQMMARLANEIYAKSSQNRPTIAHAVATSKSAKRTFNPSWMGRKKCSAGFEFSEVRVNYEDNDTPIPARIKLQQLYPLGIALTLPGFVLVLMSR